MPGSLYGRVNGNLRTMAKSNEMMRREIPNRIAQARVQAFKVRVIIFARKVGETWKPELFVIDEANRYIYPKPTRLPKPVADLVDYGRHWNTSFGVVARRPVQFHTDLIELADVVFFFQLPGKNDNAYLESLHTGLGDTVRNLAPY